MSEPPASRQYTSGGSNITSRPTAAKARRADPPSDPPSDRRAAGGSSRKLDNNSESNRSSGSRSSQRQVPAAIVATTSVNAVQSSPSPASPSSRTSTQRKPKEPPIEPTKRGLPVSPPGQHGPSYKAQIHSGGSILKIEGKKVTSSISQPIISDSALKAMEEARDQQQQQKQKQAEAVDEIVFDPKPPASFISATTNRSNGTNRTSKTSNRNISKKQLPSSSSSKRIVHDVDESIIQVSTPSNIPIPKSGTTGGGTPQTEPAPKVPSEYNKNKSSLSSNHRQSNNSNQNGNTRNTNINTQQEILEAWEFDTTPTAKSSCCVIT